MAEQTTQRDFKTVDIIDYSMKSSPTQVHDAFNQIISDKLVGGLETKKREISAKIFSDNEEIPPAEVEVINEPEPETTETQWNY